MKRTKDTMVKKRKKKAPKIYTLTTVGEYVREGRKKNKATQQRCIGWFVSRAEARRAAVENRFDAGEAGYYQFIVIEALSEGIYPCDIKPEWYRIPRGFCRRCKKIACPKQWNRIVGWSLG